MIHDETPPDENYKFITKTLRLSLFVLMDDQFIHHTCAQSVAEKMLRLKAQLPERCDTSRDECAKMMHAVMVALLHHDRADAFFRPMTEQLKGKETVGIQIFFTGQQAYNIESVLTQNLLEAQSVVMPLQVLVQMTGCVTEALENEKTPLLTCAVQVLFDRQNIMWQRVMHIYDDAEEH